MSDTMTEGVIAAWHKKVGDTVKAGDVLAEVETDKATMELESYSAGTLLHIGVQQGEGVPVDALIAIIGKQGEDFTALLNGAAPTAQAASTAPTTASLPTNDAKVTMTSEPASSATATPAASGGNVKATVIRMPKMSDTMTDGTIAAWHKKVGEKVKSGDVLAEVETDKATMELESYDDGTLLYIGIEAGNSVPVDGIIAIIGDANADYKSLLAGGVASSSAPTQNEAVTAQPVISQQAASSTPSAAIVASPSIDSDERIKASPLAKKIAEEKGVDLYAIKGSGDGGRVVRKDVETFTPSATTAPAQATSSASSTQVAKPLTPAPVALGTESYEEVPVSQMRKTIARRLAESKFTAPHFYLTMEIDMDNAMAARKSINDSGIAKISFNDMVVKACAMALRLHPKVNSSWRGETIRYNEHVHIGVAVAVDEGLLVPVVRFANEKGLSQIGAEVKSFAEKAKNKKLQPSDWEGNTFTISNLGMFGIEEFTAIINPPDACILAVGGIKSTPVVKNGAVVPGNVMKVTLSCDHRVVDGASGAAFLQTLKSYLENPVMMIV